MTACAVCVKGAGVRIAVTVRAVGEREPRVPDPCVLLFRLVALPARNSRVQPCQGKFCELVVEASYGFPCFLRVA